MSSIQIKQFNIILFELGFNQCRWKMNTVSNTLSLISSFIISVKVLLYNLNLLWNLTINVLLNRPWVWTQNMNWDISALISTSQLIFTFSFQIFLHELFAYWEILQHAFHFRNKLVSTFSFQFHYHCPFWVVACWLFHQESSA